MVTKKSFYLFKDSLNILDELSDKKAGKLFKAIRSYQENSVMPNEFWLKIALKPFVNQFIRDNEQYNSVCKKNKKNGAKGGRPKNPVGFTKTQIAQSVNLKPKKPDKDTDKGNDKNKGNDNNSRSVIKNKPTILQIEKYFLKKIDNSKFESEKFFKYNDAMGWKKNGQEIENWKSIADLWLLSEEKFKKEKSSAKKEKQTGAQEFKEFVSNSISHE